MTISVSRVNEIMPSIIGTDDAVGGLRDRGLRLLFAARQTRAFGDFGPFVARPLQRQSTIERRAQPRFGFDESGLKDP
jgi:hypothetical protein